MDDANTREVGLRIVNSLQDGVPSVDDVMLFSSSNHPLDNVIKSDLEEVSIYSYGKVKFLNGSYGEGKSHFLSRVRRTALDDNFLVSMFEISPRGVSLDMMERAFSEIIKNLVVKEFQKSYEGTTIEFIVSEWVSSNSDYESDLRRMRLDKDFKAAILEVARRVNNRDVFYDDLAILDRWFRAEKPNIGQLQRQFKIYNHINPRNVFDILKSLSTFVKIIGFKGICILVDEQEIISTLLTTRRRELTDQNIRILIDDQSNMNGIYLLFATTDEFFNDPIRGVVAYPALKTRITRSNTLNLPAITGREMSEIAINIRKICEIAWNVPMLIENSQLLECVKIAENLRIPSARARTYVKSIIRLMENIRDGKRDNLVSMFEEIYSYTFEEVATAREKLEAEIS